MNNSLRKIILKQVVINSFILLLAFLIFRGVSYSMKTDDSINKDLLIKTGNMQVVLNVPNEKYELKEELLNGVSDEVGLRQDGYTFSVTNTGNIPIEYYEIRMVDEENKRSTMPHKYLRFNISKDKKTNTIVKNLGDEDSIIYSGYNLGVGDIASFNLKMWQDARIENLNEKELYLGIEITLYQKFDMYDNYVLYDSTIGDNIPSRTSIYNPISTVIPKRDGYKFLGWKSDDSDTLYLPGDNYQEEKGKTLYPVWEKNNDLTED